MPKQAYPDDQSREEHLRRKIAAGSQNPQDYHDLADILCSSKHYADAISLYEQTSKLPFTNIQKGRMSLELGWLAYEMGDRERAMVQAQDTIVCLSREEDTPEVLLVRGMSQSLLAHCLTFAEADAQTEAARSAVTWFDRLLVEVPDFKEIASVYMHAARLQNLLGNSKEAVNLCKKCLQLDLSKVERLTCLLDLADALRLEKQFTEGEKAVVQALQLVETDSGKLPQIYFTLGAIQRAAGRALEAKKTFERVLVEVQAHPYLHDDQEYFAEVRWNLGHLYYELGEYQEALATFQKLLEHYRNDNLHYHNALFWLGQSHQATGAYTQARNYYEKILASTQASGDEKASVQQALGKLHYDLGEHRDAVEAFLKVVAHFKEDDPIYCNATLWLGYSYQATGAYAEARDCFEKVLLLSQASENEKTSAKEAIARLPQSEKRTLH